MEEKNTFEQSLERLEVIVRSLERGDAPLEENLTEIENFLTYSCESGGNSGESSRLLRV